ncbi:MAG: elongation factor P [Tissierellia bacterium]|nr:elongation factor P [Tissierellia bacterium]
MISAGDFRKGSTFEMDGEVWQVIEFQHVKPGKGAAFVRTKLKSVMSGARKDVTFSPNEKYQEARIETKKMQYLYNDGSLYYFMDNETYEQIPMGFEIVEDAIIYIRENEEATVKFYQGNPIEIIAPDFVELKVVETEPGVKGDTATGATKPAKVETGAVVTVPLFVNEGDVIKIDTRVNEYLSRV